MSDPDIIPLPLADDDARRRIREDLDTNLLVEAGAGSGKTTELVHRMVALVESGAATVDRIAAVTFTRKAAGELRERFQSRLEERIAETANLVEGGDRGGRSAPGDSGEEVRANLRAALDDIDRAFVGTIHAFCARLLRERPLEVGLDPAFEELPAERRDELRRRFWASYLERLVRDRDPILDDLSAAGLRPRQLVGLFDKLVDNPDVTFPATEQEPPSQAEIGSVRAELESLVDQGLELMPAHEPERGWDSLQKKLRTLAFTRDVTGWREPAEFFDALERICKLGDKGHDIVQKRWKDKGLAVALKTGVDAFAVGDTAARRVLDRWYAHRYALAMRLAGRAAGEFAEYRRRRGVLDFQDLLLLSARLLRRSPGARRELGARYRRLLVDEFQDTDPLQAEVVFLLASEPEESATEGAEADWREALPRPGALFVVGDPKQSIYRFRRADIQLYELVKRGFARFGGVLDLTTNFRSRPPIGDLVNDLFAGAGFFGAEATEAQARFERLNTRPRTGAAPAEGVFWYGVEPARAARAAVAADDAERLASWIRMRIEAGERAPGDFLVLTSDRRYLASYARALEARSIPLQVTGAGVGVELELDELMALLRCMIDPTDPVKVVAVLVGLFFGLDQERLVAHRLAGGSFDVVRPGRRGHPEVVSALGDLHGWWREARSEPADVFVARAVTGLGLLPFAAAGDLGSIRAGALAYALDAVRAGALAGDASLPGALDALAAALDAREAEAPLEPARTDVVRLMNLHQAKGLEAPVVVLADPSHPGAHRSDAHTERLADGTAVGWLSVTDPTEGWGRARVLARPLGWEEKKAAEVRFEQAEKVRLLYVAATRARDELVVARWPEKPDGSAWSALDPWLLEHATRLEMEIRPPRPRETLTLAPEQAALATEEARTRLAALAEPSYRHVSVTEVVRGREGGGEERRAARDGSETDGEALRGYAWGSVVHGALAAATSAPTDEGLARTCRALLVEHGRPLGERGEPVELDELLGLVAAVRASELWGRAQRAARTLAEIPFAARGVRGGDAAPTEVLEGVIDLAFKEDDGWVIADYKTDVGTDPDFPARLEEYRRQVDLYARAWGQLTGEPVKERVLFFTAQDRVEVW
jgi:ATP-dependent helicase/nuclease subunit A